VPDDEQAKPAPDHDPGIACGNTDRVYNFDVAKLTAPLQEPTSPPINENRIRYIFAAVFYRVARGPFLYLRARSKSCWCNLYGWTYEPFAARSN
jgi:hypothetical protein